MFDSGVYKFWWGGCWGNWWVIVIIFLCVRWYGCDGIWWLIICGGGLSFINNGLIIGCGNGLIGGWLVIILFGLVIMIWVSDWFKFRFN